MIEPEVSSSGQEAQGVVYGDVGGRHDEVTETGEMPDSTTTCSHSYDSNHQFAAALTAKLDSLTDIRGSPPELGEYENPDSMETQGDALCVGSGPPSPGSRDPLCSFPEFDLTNSPNSYQVPDCDPDSTFTSSILPTYGPLPDPAAEPGYEDSLTAGLFNEEPSQQSGDLADESAVPAVCGFRNLGNTCYMNSGLQCLLASPSLVEYFLHFNPNTKLDCEKEELGQDNKSNTDLAISRQFASLVQQVYCGKFSVIQPDKFKDIFSSSHDQFSGFRQHDCQEFLALLLDSLHEQLVSVGGRAGVCPLSECTSMELHTPHSTEVSCNDTNNVFNFSITGKMLDKDEEREFESVSEVGRADLESVNNIDGMESRGSASPKSYTSHSSLEEKVSASIRMAPIPESVKTDWTADQGDSRASLASLDSEQDEGSEEGEAGGVITSNLVPSEQLKKKTVVFSDTVNSLGLQERNNAVSPMNVNVSMEDFYKEHKTLNVNMNNENTAMNNKISFDSEKFRSTDNTRPATTIENLNTVEGSDKVVNVKRVKCTNMENGGQDSDSKRIRLENSEKNVVMETERRVERRECETEPPSCCAETARDPARLKEAIEADRYWEKYLAKNKTVVAHSFQGQFKNTVICSVCNHVSVSFEPFMYLSVPLPRAVERQVEVVVVLDGEATSHLVTLSQHDRVEDLRAALVSKLSLGERRLVLCEVTRHRISRQLEDSVWLRFVNATNRKLYCLEVLTMTEEMEQVTSSSGAELEEDLVSSSVMSSSRSSSRSDLASTTVSSSTSTGTLTEEPGGPGEAEAAAVWRSCNICLEDMPDTDLISHIYCTAQLCRDCLERSQATNPGKCPVCLATYSPEEWVQLDVSHGVKPPLRMLTLSLIFMTSQAGEKPQRFGHPRLLHLPNLCRLGGLLRLLERLGGAVSPSSIPQFRLVTEMGDACSRCPGTERCEGCLLQSVDSKETQGEIVLKPGDNIAVSFQELEKNVVEEANRSRQDISMESERVKPELELIDCLDAFSSREVLDEANPWYCPVCRTHQVATRTLSVWRYPDFLVIYLKRFVYLERGPGGMAGSVKLDKRVNFPLDSLDLTPYLSGPLQQGGEMFDLYGAVCHYGSVSGGHYTAFVKHCQSHAWNLFNDAQVEARPPEGPNQDDAYVLFYKRSGLSYSLNMPHIASKSSHSN